MDGLRLGQKITAVRPLDEDEMNREFWSCDTPNAIVLEDGTLLYAAQDEEGNGPGELLGVDSTLVGQKVVDIKLMTAAQMRKRGWEGWQNALFIMLDNNKRLIPSADAEQNRPGAIFGQSPAGQTFSL